MHREGTHLNQTICQINTQARAQREAVASSDRKVILSEQEDSTQKKPKEKHQTPTLLLLEHQNQTGHKKQRQPVLTTNPQLAFVLPHSSPVTPCPSSSVQQAGREVEVSSLAKFPLREQKLDNRLDRM